MPCRDDYELFGQFEIEEDEMTSEEWLWVQGNPGDVGSWKVREKCVCVPLHGCSNANLFYAQLLAIL